MSEKSWKRLRRNRRIMAACIVLSDTDEEAANQALVLINDTTEKKWTRPRTHQEAVTYAKVFMSERTRIMNEEIAVETSETEHDQT